MISIRIKLDKEDIILFLKIINATINSPLNNAADKLAYDIHIDLKLKLNQSYETAGNLSLNTAELIVFQSLLKKYIQMGNFEYANAHILIEEINKQISKKIFKKYGK